MNKLPAIGKTLPIILTIVTLDAIGIGLIAPVLPTLLRELVHSEKITTHVGILLSLYALMQVIFAPILGALSDYFGRRRVLLFSLAGAAIDYVLMTLAPTLWILYGGRILAGITGATGAVASSSIADITESAERSHRFGLMGACFGAGMIAGPMIGGLIGSFSPRAPFAAAAIANALSFIISYFLLPETKSRAAKAVSLKECSPFQAFRWNIAIEPLKVLLCVFFMIQLVGQVPATLWVIFCENRFLWDPTTIGQSLAAFGALHALAQIIATGPLTARFGERWSLILGMLADSLGYLLLAFATQGWMLAIIMPMLALGGIGTPALQSLLSSRVKEEEQGKLQGVLSSLTSLTSIIGPLLFSAIYASSYFAWSGWPWLIGAALYLLCLPLLQRERSVLGRISPSL